MQAQTCSTRGGSTHHNKTRRGNAEQKPITMNAETGRYTRENWNSGRNKGEKHMPLCKMWQELIKRGRGIHLSLCPRSA
jgi:hypothetical protein